MVVSGVPGVAATVGRWIDTGIKLPNPRPSLDCVILVRSSGVLAMGIPYVMFHVEHVDAERSAGQRGNRIGESTMAAQVRTQRIEGGANIWGSTIEIPMPAVATTQRRRKRLTRQASYQTQFIQISRTEPVLVNN